jgi:NitT/TauT family transport system permease protein
MVTTTITTAPGSAPEPGTTKTRHSKLSAVGLPVLGTTIAIGAWWLTTIIFEIRPFFLPAPPDVVNSFLEEPRYLLEETWVTLYETLVGFGIAVAGGLVIAVLLAGSYTIERTTMPLFVALNSIPKVALAPLLVVWLGFGPKPKIVMVVLICFFPIVVATMAGLTSTPADLSEMARSMSASWWQMFVKIRLRWALPQVFVGLKVAITLAVVGAIVAEISSPSEGLGSVIVLSGSSADTPLAFAAITLLAVLSVSLFYAIVGLERRLLPWARDISA